MTERKQDTDRARVDPDDAPELTDEMLDHAELSVGGKVIRPATGVLTKDGMRPISGAGRKRGRSSAVAETRRGYGANRPRRNGDSCE